MLKAADFRNRDDRESGHDRDRPAIWRILPESQMRAAPMIVPAVDREEASEVRPIEDDDVIEAFATD